jgi:hypothetical protein
MNVPLQACPIPPRPHWTEPVSREETLARREKFRKIGWLPPNFKPKTKKAIAAAKRLWDRYVMACRLCLRGVTERTTDDVLSGIVSILVSMRIHTFWKANITTLSPRLIRSTVRPRRRRTIVLTASPSRTALPNLTTISKFNMTTLLLKSSVWRQLETGGFAQYSMICSRERSTAAIMEVARQS